MSAKPLSNQMLDGARTEILVVHLEMIDCKPITIAQIEDL